MVQEREHLLLLRDVYDLLNSYEVDTLPKPAQERFRDMRERIDTYLDEQGYMLVYPQAERIALFHKDGRAVQEQEQKG